MRGTRALFPLLILFLAMGLILSACGSKTAAPNEGGSPSAGQTDANGTTSDQGTAKKKYIVGSDAAYAPFESVAPNGEIVGLDIDFVKKLAEVGGFEVEVKNIAWDPLFEAVKNGEVDFAASAITITDERKQTYDFTDPYFVANQLILVPEGSDVTKFEDLKTKRVAVQNSTTGHEAVKKLLGATSPQIKPFESTPLAIQDMLINGSDAVVADNAVVMEFVKQNPDKKLKIIEDPTFEKEYYGLLVKKGNQELLDTLNAAIKKLKENGGLKEIFGQDLK
ncbi:Histidine-binding protein (HBP) [[Clostridium] ultunense Esp]|uniref:basic amino acid ABC transporter substrate-binding protein n=1 Tax=Thermicanus aegyptius TaxID=94009 RepID=UPI0002B70B30|nr:basic amino acid ABC transporter substrate-binding protein [Thermicanus aegyptius]CCQ92289.1 Histidine-binding protein (HBP) [[Clostridium] ultunense Esp]